MLDWLIIGGGVHGTHISRVLTQRGGVAPDRLRVLDPHAEPLARWHACVHNTGMTFLRSPAAHNIDVQPADLHHFAEYEVKDARYTRPYHRPSTELFRQHCDAVIDRGGLGALRITGTAHRLTCGPAAMRVETDCGEIETRRVVLALGASEAPSWPDWARSLRRVAPVIDHVFDPHYTRDMRVTWQHLVVIGGGITAAQTAITMARARPGTVTLLTRHAARVAQFDSDICWIGERCLRGFRRSSSPDFRRQIIHRARNRGSMPPDVHKQLRQAERRGQLRVLRGEVCRWDRDPLGGGVLLHLQPAAAPLAVDRVLLATGFEQARPGGAMLDQAIAELGLRCGACGYPIVDSLLRWHPQIHVSGPLAELEIGPVSRNIIGARLSALRLMRALQ